MDVHIKDAAGNVVVICSSDRVVEQIDRLKQFGLGFVLDEHVLNAVKTETIILIEQKAAEFHALVVGTDDSRRAERFALNLELAQKLIAGTATAVEQQALQMQLDANQQAGHPVLKGKTLQQFAGWIVQFKSYTTLGSALIESTLIRGRAAINAAQSIEEIEQIKVQLAQQAQAAFGKLQMC